MKHIKNHIHLFYTFTYILVLFPLLGSSQVISKEPEDLFVVGSESIHFKSEINHSEYTLYINLPESYGKDRTQTYPVFYVLDGYRIFGTTTHIYNGVWDDGFTPEIIIVGITNSGSKENPTLHRTRDLTPTTIDRIVTSGGAPTFLKVLSDEIIPLTDRLYSTDKTNRTLFGTSFAGMFTHYTLFTQPSLFANYIIHNPTLWWDRDYLYKLEETFFQNNKRLHSKVIFLEGEFNDLPKASAMYEQIKEHNYNDMTIDFRLVQNMGHLGGEAEAINQGMRFVYKRLTISLPEEKLIEYCGTYKDGTYIREIAIRDGQLTLVRPGEVKGANIQVINSSEFSILGRYFDFIFNRDEKGNVIGFTSQLDTDPTRTRTAIKIK
ncbi:alpha/beta hydrolase [Aquimarina sp. 2201CG5-10]|uniref:alpha/beta hydrolase n=1 Tax=Aquimarina callyspongiae TaxID=3098150 RepID=UPI002AB3EEEB|nr:alpha/beta hydrolase-fold protein [Aquimarina sp. 2201CG5-10]MDY8136019.1 alpha/beta hydrolase-fold protein [Aquimarina sp. 2201CG5-10]